MSSLLRQPAIVKMVDFMESSGFQTTVASHLENDSHPDAGKETELLYNSLWFQVCWPEPVMWLRAIVSINLKRTRESGIGEQEHC